MPTKGLKVIPCQECMFEEEGKCYLNPPVPVQGEYNRIGDVATGGEVRWEYPPARRWCAHGQRPMTKDEILAQQKSILTPRGGGPVIH